MHNSFALDAAEMVAQSLAGTRPCHLVQKNGLLPIIKCPSIVGAGVDENTYLADVASERLSISNYAPVGPKKDPLVRLSNIVFTSKVIPLRCNQSDKGFEGDKD